MNVNNDLKAIQNVQVSANNNFYTLKKPTSKPRISWLFL